MTNNIEIFANYYQKEKKIIDDKIHKLNRKLL